MKCTSTDTDNVTHARSLDGARRIPVLMIVGIIAYTYFTFVVLYCVQQVGVDCRNPRVCVPSE